MTAMTATIPPPMARARGDAWRPRPPTDRTGGGALTDAVRRASLLFFPLGTGGKGSWLLAAACRREA